MKPGTTFKSERPIDKVYFSISEVAAIFDVAPSLLRFWQREFPANIRPRKNRKGNRYYTPSDIESVREIYYLVKVELYTLAGARKKLENL